MDNTSPGFPMLPVNVGAVGAVNNTAITWPTANAACCAPVLQFQAYVIEWPWGGWPATNQPAPQQHTHYHAAPFTFTPKLSDEDVERIAKRVAELIKAP